MANQYISSTGISSEENFSYRLLNKELTIPLEQEMMVSDLIEISDEGCLDIEGIFTVLGA